MLGCCFSNMEIALGVKHEKKNGLWFENLPTTTPRTEVLMHHPPKRARGKTEFFSGTRKRKKKVANLQSIVMQIVKMQGRPGMVIPFPQRNSALL